MRVMDWIFKGPTCPKRRPPLSAGTPANEELSCHSCIVFQNPSPACVYISPSRGPGFTAFTIHRSAISRAQHRVMLCIKQPIAGVRYRSCGNGSMGIPRRVRATACRALIGAALAVEARRCSPQHSVTSESGHAHADYSLLRHKNATPNVQIGCIVSVPDAIS